MKRTHCRKKGELLNHFSSSMIHKTQEPQSQMEKEISRDLLIAEVKAWAHRIGVDGKMKEIRVRPMKRKWASCSSRGRITLDEGLLSMPANFRKFVIVHELLHLKVPNHGRLFRQLLRAYLSMDDTVH